MGNFIIQRLKYVHAKVAACLLNINNSFDCTMRTAAISCNISYALYRQDMYIFDTGKN